MEKKPHILQFNKIGSPNLGYISVVENFENIPFDFKRVYWTYFTPQDVTRGGHAHLELEQVIVAVSGSITFNTEDLQGNKLEFVLDRPDKGLFIPKHIWRDIKFSHNAVLLCLASKKYAEDDYIRDYETFLNLTKTENLTLVEYKENILEKSWIWLNDPEIKELTQTPNFSKDDQENWFKTLETSENYFIKGLKYHDEIIGVAGLKHIDKNIGTAEYFGYIGEKKYWGNGLSKEILTLILAEAKNQFQLKSVYLKVSCNNVRAIRAYENFGFRIIKIEGENVLMNYKM